MATSFNEIIKEISKSVDSFHKKIPGLQAELLDNLLEKLRRLDVDRSGNLKSTVANIKIMASIKSKLTRLILNDSYLAGVKDFVNAFSSVSTLQNDYWKSVEPVFQPKPLLREIRTQAIRDTATSLTENGIGANITDNISNILRQNITSGGSYRSLEKQLRESLTDTERGDGLLTRYTKQITIDSINQYSAQYTQAVSAGLDFEWYAYANSDIKTTRPFCDAMTDFRYFHVSEVPRLLRAEGLTYENKKTGKREAVPIYAKTGLPAGMIAGTNAENFFVNRGGYQCNHQIRPVSEGLVPLDIQTRVKATPEYIAWKKLKMT